MSENVLERYNFLLQHLWFYWHHEPHDHANTRNSEKSDSERLGKKIGDARCSELEKRKNGSAISLLPLSAFSSAGTNRKIAVRNN